MKILVCGMALAVLSAQAGTNVYVSATGSYTTDDGETHAAWTDLQGALNAADKGDTVWVEDGYEWAPGENRYTDATYGGRVLGVPKEMTVRSRSGKWETGAIVRGRWNSADAPKGANALCGVCLAKNAKIMGFQILDCAANTALGFNLQAGAGLVGTLDCTAENCLIANCRANYGAASYYVDLKGCVVSNCNASTYATFTYGGGAKDCLFIDNNIYETGANAVRYGHNYERCTFVNNTGTGVLIDADGTTYPTAVADCVFSNNTVYCIGAAHRKDKRVIVRNCLFTGNSNSCFYAHYQATKYYNNFVTAYNCTITNNPGTVTSGCLGMAGDYVNCLLADNDWSRGALIGQDDPDQTIRLLNCTVVDNTSTEAASPVASERVSAINTILDGNVGKSGTTPTLASATSCVVDFTATTETDCQHVDPALVNRAGGLYQPSDASPCLGRGSLTAYELTETDLAGRPRLTGGKVSVGAYEYDPSVKYVEAAVTGYPKYMYAPAKVSFAASVCGLGTQGVLFHWDFDNDGTVDYITSQASFTYALGVGDYDPMLYISNATEGVSYYLDTTFSILARPVRYVKAGNEGAAAPYTTEKTAAADIQTALDVCADGDEVVILPGVYETDAPVCVTNELIVHGQTGKPEDVVIHQTVANRCLQICGGKECVVHSLAVENGLPSATFDYGAGVYMAMGKSAGGQYTPGAGSGILSNVIVRNCRLSNKWSVCAGVYARGVDCLVTHCILTNNTSEASYADGGYVHGVALHLEAGAKAENCLMAYNTSKDIYNTLATKNIWEGWSSGVTLATAFVGNESVLRYSTVVSNRMSFCGGVNVDGTGRFETCIIAGNEVFCKNVREESDRFRVWAAFPFAYRADRFFHTTPKAGEDFEQYYHDYMAAEAARAADADRKARLVTNAVDVDETGLGEGTIVSDVSSLFRNFPRNFRLRTGSPAVDVVPEESESDMPSLDLLGNPRLVNGAYDLGCFEKAESRGLLMMFR